MSERDHTTWLAPPAGLEGDGALRVYVPNLIVGKRVRDHHLPLLQAVHADRPSGVVVSQEALRRVVREVKFFRRKIFKWQAGY